MRSSREAPTVSDLVLVGGGHAHVHVLKMLGMPTGRRLCQQHGIQVTLVTSDLHTPYSGMLPGYVAGHYTWDQIHIDLSRLCRWAGVRLVHAAVNRITYHHHHHPPSSQPPLSSTRGEAEAFLSQRGGGGGGYVYCNDDRPPLRYDALSIDIGSAPASGDTVYHDAAALNGPTLSNPNGMRRHRSPVIPVKPIVNFTRYYENLSRQWQQQQENNNNNINNINNSHAPSCYTICVVGGGAGGIELALSVQHHLHQLIMMQEPLPSPRPQQRSRWAPDLSLQERLRVMVVTRGTTLLEGHNRPVQRIFERILRERHIAVYYQAQVVGVEPVPDDSVDQDSSGVRPRRQQRLVLSEASRRYHPEPIMFDDCIWCITAGVASWLAEKTPFATTADGFLRVNDTYEAIFHPGVFAAGDCCHMDPHPRPKAGVFAVRAGPYLRENLINYLLRKPLLSHRPQSDFLGIISTGDKYAVASKGWWFWWEGQWVWAWKNWIDLKFMDKFSELPDLEQMMSKMKPPTYRDSLTARLNPFLAAKGVQVLEAFSADPMRCGGCGAKVGSTTVARVLRAIYQRQVVRAQRLNYAAPRPIDHDDAAIIPLTHLTGSNLAHASLIQTIDYFRELVSDPFLFGKIVAVHALSDIHAMGATAETALVLAVVPFAADDAVTESTLLQLLSGVSDVLQDEGVQIVGGHTCEGIEMACGLSIQGITKNTAALLRKQGGRIMDKIVLTKPLGTGALFAADMRAKGRGEYVMEAWATMLQSNRPASRVAVLMGSAVHSCTDVTGFGLIGHLLEMLMANDFAENQQQIAAVLDIGQIPFLRGGLHASAQGIFSTLQSQNARNRRAVINHAAAAKAFPVEYPLLFDPQTAGGLLFLVDPTACPDFLANLAEDGVSANVIGQLEAYPTAGQGYPGMDANNNGDVYTIGNGFAEMTGRIRIEI